MTKTDASQTGGCLCGAVRFRIDGDARHDVNVCHCDMCRRWATGPLMVIMCGPDVTFEGEDKIGIYRSSDRGERGFCRTCGSNLFFRDVESGGLAMAAGAFDDPTGFEMESQIYIEEKPAFYSFAEATPKLTAAEFAAVIESRKS